jgi:hypothetical protein
MLRILLAISLALSVEWGATRADTWRVRAANASTLDWVVVAPRNRMLREDGQAYIDFISFAPGVTRRGELWLGRAGGVDHSPDCRRTWRHLPEHWARPAGGEAYIGGSIAFVAVTAGNRVFLTTTYDGVAVSTDGGTTWRQGLGQPSPTWWPGPPRGPATLRRPQWFVVSPGPDGAAYGVFEPFATWRSLDGGITWHNWPSRPWTGVKLFAVDPLDPAVLYGASGGGYGVYIKRSVDDGLTFQPYAESFHPEPPFPDEWAISMAISPDASRFWMVTTSGMIYLSRDRGVTWNHVSDGPPDEHPKTIHHNPFDPRAGFVLTREGGLWGFREPVEPVDNEPWDGC